MNNFHKLRENSFTQYKRKSLALLFLSHLNIPMPVAAINQILIQAVIRQSWPKQGDWSLYKRPRRVLSCHSGDKQSCPQTGPEESYNGAFAIMVILDIVMFHYAQSFQVWNLLPWVQVSLDLWIDVEQNWLKQN